MKTLILPGFSLKNKEWAEETQKQLNKHADTSVIYWQHWETGKTESSWIDDEVNNLVETINKGKVNIIAKSIGTLVAMKYLA